jgi:hypothetical protein
MALTWVANRRRNALKSYRYCFMQSKYTLRFINCTGQLIKELLIYWFRFFNLYFIESFYENRKNFS